MIEYLPVIRDIVGIVGVIIGLSYYIMTLRNQSRTRQIQIIKGANVLGDFVWRIYLHDTSNIETVISEINELESDFRKDYLDYFNSLEELGMYLREGLLDVRYVALLAGGGIITLWEKYEPVNLQMRADTGSRYLTEAEYLYQQLKEYVKKHPELAP